MLTVLPRVVFLFLRENNQIFRVFHHSKITTNGILYLSTLESSLFPDNCPPIVRVL